MDGHEFIAALLEACPSIQPEWEKHLAEWAGEERGLYIDASVVAHHLTDLAKRGDTASFPAVFETVERYLLQADEETRGLVVVGLLEDLQNFAERALGDYGLLEPWLGPETLKAWREVQAFWDGLLGQGREGTG